MEEIVNGIDVFREAFAPFADSFIVIGGSACRAVIPEGDIRPRKTTDIDMVLVPQELSAGFVGTFWKFIKEGGYKFASRKNKDGDKRYVFYSFVDGKEGYPDQIELLSKPDESIGTPAEHHIEYIDTGEEYSHLSAIILDRNYYDYLTSQFEVVDGIRYASADEDFAVFQYHLVPTFDFKQELLSRGPSVEVLTPTWFRDEVADDVAEMAKLYAR